MIHGEPPVTGSITRPWLTMFFSLVQKPSTVNATPADAAFDPALDRLHLAASRRGPPARWAVAFRNSSSAGIL